MNYTHFGHSINHTGLDWAILSLGKATRGKFSERFSFWGKPQPPICHLRLCKSFDNIVSAPGFTQCQLGYLHQWQLLAHAEKLRNKARTPGKETRMSGLPVVQKRCCNVAWRSQSLPKQLPSVDLSGVEGVLDSALNIVEIKFHLVCACSP